MKLDENKDYINKKNEIKNIMIGYYEGNQFVKNFMKFNFVVTNVLSKENIKVESSNQIKPVEKVDLKIVEKSEEEEMIAVQNKILATIPSRKEIEGNAKVISIDINFPSSVIHDHMLKIPKYIPIIFIHFEREFRFNMINCFLEYYEKLDNCIYKCEEVIEKLSRFTDRTFNKFDYSLLDMMINKKLK
jgi:hypothetical protein